MLTSLFLLLALADDPAAADPPSPASAPTAAPDQSAPAAEQPPPPAAPQAADPPKPLPAAAQAEPDVKPADDGEKLRSRVSDLEGRLKSLAVETAAAKAEAKAARSRADRAYEEALSVNRYHNGAGLGLLVPTKDGDTRFGINANLHWLTAQWVPTGGIGIGMAPTIEIWRLRLRVFDIGAFYDYGKLMSVPDIKRSLDITLASGIDVRIWKGLALHTQIGWFLPNPVSLYNAASAQYDAAQGMGGGTGTLGGAISSIGDAKSAGQYALNRFADACKSPMLTVAVDWQF